MGDYSLQKIHNSPSSFFDELDKRMEIKENNKKDDDIYKFHSLTKIIDTEYKPDQWIVDKLIPLDGITCIGGLPATMKSYFSNYLALKIVSGENVFEYKTTPVNILYIDKENKMSRIQDRFLKLGITTKGSDKIFFMESNFIIDNTKDLATVCQFIKDHDIQLTFIDTLVRVHNKEENSASEMNRVFLGMKEMMIAGSGICFLHHFNKRGGFGVSIDVRDQLRGSGDILAMVDSYIALSRRENMIEVEQAKSRDEVVVPKFLMEPVFTENTTDFIYNRIVVDEDRLNAVMVGDQILSAMSHGSITREYLITVIGENKRASIDRALKQLKNEGRITGYRNGKGTIYSLNNQP